MTGFCKSQLITCNRVKECNGVCPFEDALKHADKTQAMDEQHIVDHDRDWIIGCIEHDGFIHTNRFDKANQIIHDALSAEAEWIPVEERLPSKNQEVLLQCHHNMIVGYWMDGDFVGEKEWRALSGDGWENDCGFPNDVFEPLAWMPLPEPYREGGKEDD